MLKALFAIQMGIGPLNGVTLTPLFGQQAGLPCSRSDEK
jgi:hypothetical protein